MEDVLCPSYEVLIAQLGPEAYPGRFVWCDMNLNEAVPKSALRPPAFLLPLFTAFFLSFFICLYRSFLIVSPFGHRQISATIACRMEKPTTSLAAPILRLNILKRDPASVTREVTIVQVHIASLVHKERARERERERGS
jgi:hypothetical protein